MRKSFDNNIIRGFHLRERKDHQIKDDQKKEFDLCGDSKVAKDESVFRLISYSNSYSLELSSLISFLRFF